VPEKQDGGALTEAVFYILLSLHKPMHGYAVMQNIERLTQGRVMLGAGTLYGAINALVQRRWIAALSAEKDSRRKEYSVTPAGRAAFAQELERLRELLRNGEEGKNEACDMEDVCQP
jgi:DNA-binding PadR family transcriptional regulator